MLLTSVATSCSATSTLAGGRERVATALEQQARDAGEALDAEAAMKLADEELQAMRRERPAKRS